MVQEVALVQILETTLDQEFLDKVMLVVQRQMMGRAVEGAVKEKQVILTVNHMAVTVRLG